MALFSIDTGGALQPHLMQEWLLTNGLGGYSASTVVGCNTRRYHGLLCAATQPPVGRIIALTRIEEMVTLDDDAAHAFDISVNQFHAAFHPHGWQHLRRFTLEDVARWEYDVDGVSIVKEVQLAWRQNVVGVRYTVRPTRPRKVRLSLAPFFSLRDFHSLRHVNDWPFESEPEDRAVTASVGTLRAQVSADAGAFSPKPDWWYGHYYSIEGDRGADNAEDLFTPGAFRLEYSGAAAQSITLWASLDQAPLLDWDEQLKLRKEAWAKSHVAASGKPAAGLPTRTMVSANTESLALKRLVRAANDFVVFRKMPSGEPGATVIAGYPWFADWGRDTMISLPGLLLVTGRFAEARQVLSVFAEYCSEGMIPNRFDDYTNEPSYNTVDASLWFIHAVFEYLTYTADLATFDRVLRPACRQIIDGYRNGTRYHIKMDPADGLISQGDAQTQLTWMDAKCNGVAFTPRQGKAVEINALWYHALRLMGENELAEKVADSFRKAYWIDATRGLADVVDGSPRADGYYAQRDLSLRPNQIFAVSLPNTPLTPDQQRAVVDIVQRELLTPMGLRSLGRGDWRYCGRYNGDQFHRDSCYHNGTVWAWLIGGFLSAYLRVNQRSNAAVGQVRAWLAPLIDQMSTASIGQISEIFEGDPPHRMAGCPGQAWSVAEVLRVAADVGM